MPTSDKHVHIIIYLLASFSLFLFPRICFGGKMALYKPLKVFEYVPTSKWKYITSAEPINQKKIYCNWVDVVSHSRERERHCVWLDKIGTQMFTALNEQTLQMNKVLIFCEKP